MTPHECYACEALREAEEEGHRIQNRDKRDTIKRKAEPEEEQTPQERYERTINACKKQRQTQKRT